MSIELKMCAKRVDELTEKNAELLAALKKAQEDINWMTNSQQLLSRFVFNYIDDAITKAENSK